MWSNTKLQNFLNFSMPENLKLLLNCKCLNSKFTVTRIMCSLFREHSQSINQFIFRNNMNIKKHSNEYCQQEK